MKIKQTGRSMVEMLGVLAVIGVLSAGALAGYSKAMLQYKLNIQSEQINTIMDGILLYANKISEEKGSYLSGQSLVPFLKAINAVDEKMYIKGDSYNLRDIFEHNIAIVVYKAYYGVYVEFKVYLRATDIKPCINLYQIASLRNADLWRVKIQQYNTGTSSTESGSVLSDLHCYNGAKCFKNLTLSDIEGYCEDGLKAEVNMFYFQYEL
ncbi:MAG: hypothetical protein IJ870_06125 [Alphaproteobacteria bacterium]|nr:hypothetical protein [Alphaproteobacteria bacterium]